MASLLLDKQNNLITNNNFIEVSGDEGLLQDSKNIVSLLKNENPFDNEDGIDYLNYMAVSDIKSIVNEIIERLSADSRISSVDVEIIRNDVEVKLNVTITSKETGENYELII